MSKVLKTIVNVILFCAIVVAAGLLIPPFAGITTVMVDDVDMQTNLPQGSVAYAVEKDRSELKQGDKVLISQEGRQYVYVVDSIDGSRYIRHFSLLPLFRNTVRWFLPDRLFLKRGSRSRRQSKRK